MTKNFYLCFVYRIVIILILMCFSRNQQDIEKTELDKALKGLLKFEVYYKKVFINKVHDYLDIEVLYCSNLALFTNQALSLPHLSFTCSTSKNSWPPPELWTILWLVKTMSRGMIAGLWLDNTAAYTFLRGSTIVWCTVVLLNICIPTSWLLYDDLRLSWKAYIEKFRDTR
jgi:hypothetical protein